MPLSPASDDRIVRAVGPRAERLTLARVIGGWIAAVLTIAIVAVGTGGGPALTSLATRAHAVATGATAAPSAPGPGDRVATTDSSTGAMTTSNVASDTSSNSSGSTTTDPVTGLPIPPVALPGASTTTQPFGPGDQAQPTPAAIAGRVVDEAGQPVPNECVTVFAMWLLGHDPSMTTGPDGRFSFSSAQIYPLPQPVPQEAGGAVVIANDCSTRLPGYQTTSVHIDVPGPPQDLTVSVQPGAVVTGTLVDAMGLPLAGYCVNVGVPMSTTPNQHDITDALGHFTVNGVVPGPQPLSVEPTCTADALIDVAPGSTNAIGVDTLIVTVPASEDAIAAAHLSDLYSNHATHTIGATTEPGESPPSCLSGVTRSAWLVVRATDRPTFVVAGGAGGAGAIAVYAPSSNGLGAELGCTPVSAGSQVELALPDTSPFGGEYVVEVASGPSPVAVVLGLAFV